MHRGQYVHHVGASLLCGQIGRKVTASKSQNMGVRKKKCKKNAFLQKKPAFNAGRIDGEMIVTCTG